jgi:hypothetical protein
MSENLETPPAAKFIQDRVTIRVDAQGRILDLRYG